MLMNPRALAAAAGTRVRCRPMCCAAAPRLPPHNASHARLGAPDAMKQEVAQELAPLLKGIMKATRRMRVMSTEVLDSVAEIALDQRGRSRCEHLNLSLRWVAEPVGSAAKSGSITGVARITLGSVDDEEGSARLTDMVKVTVDVGSVSGCPELADGSDSPDAKRLLADVVMAVQSLDSVVMEKLNDFLWSVEQRASRLAAAEASA